MPSYFRDQIALHRKAARSAYQGVLKRLGPQRACALKNAAQRIAGKPVRFDYDDGDKLFVARDANGEAWFAERLLGFYMYAEGITQRGQTLADSYALDRVAFNPGDVVIDCGANHADLSIYLRNRSPDVRYIAFEPSPEEFRCVRRNAPHGTHNNLALYDRAGEFDFYLSSRLGDSSLTEPAGGYTDVVTVKATTLDEYLADNGIGRVRLLKLEAEGLEPEVLAGAKASLGRIDYIAADGGDERGLNAASTIETIANILIGAGFEMVDLDLKLGWGRALFRNVSVPTDDA